MKGNRLQGLFFTLSLISLFLAPPALVWAETPIQKPEMQLGNWAQGLALGAYIQGSYVGNLNSPSTKTNQARVFDVESNSFNLNAFHLHFSKPLDDSGWGFTGKLLTGRDARIIKSAGTAGATDFDVQEAYVSVRAPGLKNLTFVGGKFVTLEGVEIIESPLNPNLSEGLLFGFAEPFTHTGLKANYALNGAFNGTFGLVNGWDNSAESTTAGNDGKTVIWQLATTAIRNVTAVLEGTYGPEASTDNQSKRTSLDAVINVTPTSHLSLWLQGNWGQDTNVVRSGGGGPADVVAAYPAAIGPSTVSWKALGAWAQYAFCPWYGQALRFEVFDDEQGANRFGLGMNQTMKEITWTHKFNVARNVFTRLEYRHDWSNQGVFVKQDPGSAGRVQNTVGMDWVLVF